MLELEAVPIAALRIFQNIVYIVLLSLNKNTCFNTLLRFLIF
jgi:hypothetical protein